MVYTHTHSQYTSTVRLKVSDPTTLLAVIWYSPLSSRVMLAIVKLVAVTVNFVSVMGALLLVSVMLSMGGGLAPSGREKVKWSPSVGVAVAVAGENLGTTAEQRSTTQSNLIPCSRPQSVGTVHYIGTLVA